ncbi:MAG: hypoxanthine phosphoribosyltransferase [Sumerlaeia bacterium]
MTESTTGTLTNPLHANLCDILFTEEEIARRTSELGLQISKDYEGKNLVLVGILRGALIFLSDLSRSITVPHSWDMVGASSYHGGTGSSGRVQITKDVEVDLRDKHVLVVEDIYDSGRTLSAICDLLMVHRPLSVKVCTLLYKEKPERAAKTPIDYFGFRIKDKFVVGYGLDYEEMYRNLRMIGVLDPSIYS